MIFVRRIIQPSETLLDKVVAELSANAKRSGYELERLLATSGPESERSTGGGAVVVEELPERPAIVGKKITLKEGEDDDGRV